MCRRRRGGSGNSFSLASMMSTVLLIDLANETSRYKEATGNTLSGDGDNLGLLLSVEQWGGKTLDQVLSTQTELVVNGGFPLNVDNWVPSNLNVTLSHDVDRMFADMAGTWCGPYQHIPVDAGDLYKYSLDYQKGSATDYAFAIDPDRSIVWLGSGPATYSGMVTASTSGEKIYIRSGNSIGSLYLDEVSMKKIPSIAFRQTNAPEIPKYYDNPPRTHFDGVDDSLTLSFEGGAGPADCTVMIVFKSVSSPNMIFTGQDTGKWLLLSRDGDAGSLSANCGSPDLSLDNDLVTTRQDVYDGVSDLGFHIGVADHCNFSGWSEINIGGYASGWNLEGGVARIIIIPAGQELDDNRDNIITAMIEGYEVNLA